MKNIKFLLGLLAVVVIMASCATTQGATDPYENDPSAQRIGNRVYLDDPYRGTVILQQDPVTGRYYDVTTGYGFGAGYYGAYPYGGYRGGMYRGGGYRGRSVIVQPVQVPSNGGGVQQNRSDARKRILGN